MSIGCASITSYATLFDLLTASGVPKASGLRALAGFSET